MSFYNENSIVLNITPNWRDSSLAAHIDVENTTLQVHLSKDVVFQIYCRPYNDHVKSQILELFDNIKVFTFPTTLGFMPNELLQGQDAKRIFTKIDELIADKPEFGIGHYVLITAIKPQKHKDNEKFKKITEFITNQNLNFEIIDHEYVLSITDVKKELSLNDNEMIKSVIFKDSKNKVYYSICAKAFNRINENKLVNYINRNFITDKENEIIRSNITLATEREIQDLGFSIGSVSPFGYPEDVKITNLITDDVLNLDTENIYFGSGSNYKTIKMKLLDFKQLVQDFKPLNI